jgi:tetratricopeptide (TPR) repeat protein
MLLYTSNVDESIRQFDYVLRRSPCHVLALTLQAQAYRLKEMYAPSIESARNAIRLAPKSAEPHMWLAESLRLSGKYDESRREYDEYLRLSDFDSKMAGQLNYYVLGFLAGIGRKKHAAQRDIWKDLRSLAYFGMCDCERKLSRFDPAILYCQKSLTYDPKDPYAHFALALAYTRKANQTGSCETLPAALKHFRAVVDINADLAEAQMSRQNIAAIEKVRCP